MTDRVQQGSLHIDPILFNLLEQDIAPGTGVSAAQFWQALEAIVSDLGPRNRALLAIREDMQAQIDTWHREHPGADYDHAAYKVFLQDIGIDEITALVTFHLAPLATRRDIAMLGLIHRAILCKGPSQFNAFFSAVSSFQGN